MSDDLGEYNWFEAKEKADSYCGGGFNDWRLPTRVELDFMLFYLVKLEKIEDSKYGGYKGFSKVFERSETNCYWSSTKCVGGTSHYARCIDRNTIWGSKLSGTRRIGSTPFGDIRATCGNDYNFYSVRVVRSFSV